MEIKGKKVLIVEDDASMREILAYKLMASGLIVVESDDGKAGLELWEKERPDLVLLDLMLPEMDGFQVLETMRRNGDPALANAPVIVLSNLYGREEMERANELGIKDFMVKAYHTTEEILRRVTDVLTQ